MNVNNTIVEHVEKDSSSLDSIIDKVVSESTGALEAYVDNIRKFLENGTEEVSLDDLNNMALRVASYLFFLSSHVEKVGLRSSIANIIRDEKYNKCYISIEKGTIADKQAQALEEVKEEELVNIIFDRAYKILKNRYSSAERLNDTLRKIISSKISEMELTRKVDV